MRFKNVLFDLDGTLTDSENGIVNCLVYALARMGLPAPDRKVIAAMIGPPLHLAFHQLLKTEDEEVIKEAIALYRERFSEVGLLENKVYDGISEMLLSLGELRGAGLRVFLATSKPHVYARRILTHFELAPHFFAIHGSELDGTRTNKRELISYILETEALIPSESVMIGDRDVDVKGGSLNGLATAGVLWGFGSANELQAAKPTFIAENPSILTSWLLNKK